MEPEPRAVSEQPRRTVSLRRAIGGAAVAIAVFTLLGTVAALWPNPLFTRMTPAGHFEVLLLLAMSALAGTYVVIRRPHCSTGVAGTGGVLGFIGIACPVCNKVLLLLFGGELLLAYFEPVRIYVALLGTLVIGGAVIREWHRWRVPAGEAAAVAMGREI